MTQICINKRERMNHNKKIELLEHIKQSRLDIFRLDSQLTGEFIRFENRIREELIDKLVDKMCVLEDSLRELHECKMNS